MTPEIDQLHQEFQGLLHREGELTVPDVRELRRLVDRMADLRRVERLISAL